MNNTPNNREDKTDAKARLESARKRFNVATHRLTITDGAEYEAAQHEAAMAYTEISEALLDAHEATVDRMLGDVLADTTVMSAAEQEQMQMDGDLSRPDPWDGGE